MDTGVVFAGQCGRKTASIINNKKNQCNSFPMKNENPEKDGFIYRISRRIMSFLSARGS